jgi:hypothetical protein
LAAVHARIPMVTMDEQRALQLENAEADERFWSSFHGMNAGTAEDHKGLAARTASAIAKSEAAAAKAASNAKAAQERIERIKRGENVEGGLGKLHIREDFERILREAGVDPKHCARVGEVADAIGFETMMKAIHQDRHRAERATLRRLHRAIRK